MQLMKRYSEEKLPIIILGAGGHTKVLIDTLLINKRTIIGIVDTDVSRVGQTILGVKIIGGDEIVLKYSPEAVRLVNGLGSIKAVENRKALFSKFKKEGYQFTSVIHPSAIIANSVTLGEGVQVLAGAIVQACSGIGDNSIINTKASIDHDCIIDAHVHIAPGVILSGGVTVEREVHIGTGAVVIQGKKIGAQSLVAAGSVVIKDVPKAAIVMGVPGKIIENTSKSISII